MEARNVPTAKHEWLALARLPGLGPRRLARLLQHFGSPGAVFDARAEIGHLLGPSHPARDALARRADTPCVHGDLDWLARDGHHLLTLHDAHYPPLLRELPDPPVVLFVVGDPARLADPQLAIVGSRNPSPSGRETAFELARTLAASGLTVTSGLALGIDTAAHRGALACDRSATIAVCGAGHNVVYPPGNRALAGAIRGRGALVSEFPPDTPPRRENFPRRNRIISGLALGTLVVEAAARSGSLITAGFALEQGREVFAVPGPVSSPLARGCHGLLRDGATLVESAADVLEQLPGHWMLAPRARASRAPTPSLPGHLAELLALIDAAPVLFDVLLVRSGLDSAGLSAALTQLELQGLVAPCDGGRWARTGPARP